MPYADLETRRTYHREYMRRNPQVFTDEQREAKIEYLRNWRAEHPGYRGPNASESQKAWRLKNPSYMRNDHLVRTYGITSDDYDAMVEAQEHRCAICGQLTDGLVVDHCHTTGEVRGLLCDRCNVGLGCMGDNIERLMRAADYLASPVEREEV